MSQQPTIQLYAELLLNIRTVNLHISLRTAHTSRTKAELSADREQITLTHEGESATIRLPSRVSSGGGGGGGDGGESVALGLPASPPSKELTLRLQLEEIESGVAAKWAENVVPWSAGELEAGVTRIGCRRCGNVLVRTESVRVWRDLPNENWAEMMDFWHCHKPDGHGRDDDVDGGKVKGYAASNVLRASPTVGFVDVTSFLLAEQDCCGLKVGLDSSHISFRRLFLLLLSRFMPSYPNCKPQSGEKKGGQSRCFAPSVDRSHPILSPHIKSNPPFFFLASPQHPHTYDETRHEPCRLPETSDRFLRISRRSCVSLAPGKKKRRESSFKMFDCPLL